MSQGSLATALGQGLRDPITGPLPCRQVAAWTPFAPRNSGCGLRAPAATLGPWRKRVVGVRWLHLAWTQVP